MKLNKSAILIVFAALAIQAAADQQEPAYWMKKYPDVPQAKAEQCLEKAEAAYEKAGGSQARGDNGFAVLSMGTEWERCMEGGK